MELAFQTKDALLDALEAAVAAAVDGDPFFGVDVHDSWPGKGIQGDRSVLVLDSDGDEVPATLRAGGGTRDDTFRVDLAVAVIAYTAKPREVRALTNPIVAAVKALVRAEAAVRPGGCFGVAGVRQPEVLRWRLAEYALDKGRRECDVHLTVQFKGRYRATP